MNVKKKIVDIFELEGVRGLQNYILQTESDATKSNRLFEVRGFFKDKGRLDLLEYFPVDRDLIDRLNEIKGKKLDARLKSKIEIYFTLEEYREINKQLGMWKAPVHSVIRAGLNSGRRFSELESGKYKIINDTHLALLNPLKKRGKERVVNFPLLFYKSREFIEDLEYFRKSSIKHAWTWQKVTQIFKGIDSDFSFHTLRALYGFYSYELYCHDPAYDRLVWLSDVLGHEKTNYTSTLYYNKYWDNPNSKNISKLNSVIIAPVRTVKRVTPTFSKIEKRGKIITRKELEKLVDNYIYNRYNTNVRNKRKPAYLKIIDALLDGFPEEGILLEQEGMINDLRTLYQRTYDVGVSGTILKEFYNDFWGYTELECDKEGR